MFHTGDVSVATGAADCPYYAKAELLADDLAQNLDDFNLHKIVVHPDKWQVCTATQ